MNENHFTAHELLSSMRESEERPKVFMVCYCPRAMVSKGKTINGFLVDDIFEVREFANRRVAELVSKDLHAWFIEKEIK